MLGKIRTTQRIDALTMEWLAQGTFERVPRDEWFPNGDICALGGQPVEPTQ
jgi:hypothetical protein